MDFDEEEQEISPIIQIFERLTFERGHDVFDQVTSMIEIFSLSNVTLEMLDKLNECIKIVLIHQNTNKNIRILDFLVTLTHVTHINYTTNNNLTLVFDALIDIFSQTMVAIDSQIRYTTLHILNKIQTFIDLSQSPYVPYQFEQILLELLNNESTLVVLDEVLPLAAKFQHKNHQFIDALLDRLNSPKFHSYVDRRRKIISLLEYSSSSLNFLLSTIQADNELSQIAFESLLSNERGFTLDTLGFQGRLLIFQVASKSRDLSRLIFTQWISQNGYELIDILQLCKISTLHENKNKKSISMIETALRYFLSDNNIRRIVIQNTKIAIGSNNGGILLSNVSHYVEHLFIWRILCQLVNEENDDINIHPDFQEFISYFYRLIKTSINEKLSLVKEFTISQYASITSTFDILDIYRRKCIEAIGRCMLVHYGQYEIIIEQALQLIHHIYPTENTMNERYQLVTYILNDIIQCCQNEQDEELAFTQCMTISKVFIEKEKKLELNNNNNFKTLLDSLIKSGLSNRKLEIQSQTLLTLRSFMCHSRQAAMEYIKQNLHITNKVENISLKCILISTFIDVLLVHDLDILNNVNLSDFTLTKYFLGLFEQQNIEIKNLIVFGLVKLLLSSRLQPNASLLKLILDYRFSNDYRSIHQYQRDQITSFFYFFIHLSYDNVSLIEELTFDLVSRYLPFVSNNNTIAYQSVLVESMCYFCIELLSLSTLPTDRINEEYSHYHLARNLLESIHNVNSSHTSFIIKSYLNTIKHLQYQYMTKEQLENIFDLIIRLRQYPNLPSVISNSIKTIGEQIQSSLNLIKKLTSHETDDKRSRSPSPSPSRNNKRIASLLESPMASLPNVLHDRTNQLNSNFNNRPLTKGIKRKIVTNRYTTLDFENDTDDFY